MYVSTYIPAIAAGANISFPNSVSPKLVLTLDLILGLPLYRLLLGLNMGLNLGMVYTIYIYNIFVTYIIYLLHIKYIQYNILVGIGRSGALRLCI